MGEGGEGEGQRRGKNMKIHEEPEEGNSRIYVDDAHRSTKKQFLLGNVMFPMCLHNFFYW